MAGGRSCGWWLGLWLVAGACGQPYATAPVQTSEQKLEQRVTALEQAADRGVDWRLVLAVVATGFSGVSLYLAVQGYRLRRKEVELKAAMDRVAERAWDKARRDIEAEGGQVPLWVVVSLYGPDEIRGASELDGSDRKGIRQVNVEGDRTAIPIARVLIDPMSETRITSRKG